MRGSPLRAVFVLAGLLMLLCPLTAQFALAQQVAEEIPPLTLFEDVKLLLIARFLKITPTQAGQLVPITQVIATGASQTLQAKSAAYTQLTQELVAAYQAAAAGQVTPPAAQANMDRVFGALDDALAAIDAQVNPAFDQAYALLTPDQLILIMTPEDEAAARELDAQRIEVAQQVVVSFQELRLIPAEQYEANKDVLADQYIAAILGNDPEAIKQYHAVMLEAMNRARQATPDQLQRFIQSGGQMLAAQLGVGAQANFDPLRSQRISDSLFRLFLAHPRTATLLNLYAIKGGGNK